HVRAGARLQGRRHGSLLPPAAGRVRFREVRLFGERPSARSRTRLLGSSVELRAGYKAEGMAAYSRLQQAEFASEKYGYSATRHQREVGTGYFDLVSTTITGGTSSTTALHDSTEAAQFKKQAEEIKVQAAE